MSDYDFGRRRQPKKQADRFNEGKLRPSLLSPVAIEELIRVLEAGAKKYSKDNWKTGLPFSDVLDSAERHIMALKKGQLKDEETGLCHTAHVMANAMFLTHYILTKNLQWNNLGDSNEIPFNASNNLITERG